MPAPPPPLSNLPGAPMCEKTEDTDTMIPNNDTDDTDSLPSWAKITLTPIETEIETLIARNELKEAEVTYFCQVEPILQDGPQ